MRVPLPAAMITMSSAMSVFPASVLRAAIITAVCAALMLTSGCSALRLGYGSAPKLVYWWLDSYADFNDVQAPRVHDAIERWFAWHRRTQLPDYAAQLAIARMEVLADTTPARVCEWQTALFKRSRTAFEAVVPAAAQIMVTVTPKQIQHIERRYAKFNDEYRDAYLQPDPRKRADEALKRTVDRAETLYGRLDDAQRAHIAQGLQRSPFDPEVWLAERRQRQQDALQMLRAFTGEATSNGRPAPSGPSQGQAQNQAQAESALRLYADHLERSPREPYRRYTERLTEFNCAFAADLHNHTTPEQRRTAAEKLAGWEGDLRSLAGSAPSISN
jgi:hypothetical protein